jgi:hypothetical protein
LLPTAADPNHCAYECLSGGTSPPPPTPLE